MADRSIDESYELARRIVQLGSGKISMQLAHKIIDLVPDAAPQRSTDDGPTEASKATLGEALGQGDAGSAAPCLQVTRGDGVPLPDQAAAIAAFKEQARAAPKRETPLTDARWLGLEANSDFDKALAMFFLARDLERRLAEAEQALNDKTELVLEIEQRAEAAEQALADERRANETKLCEVYGVLEESQKALAQVQFERQRDVLSRHAALDEMVELRKALAQEREAREEVMRVMNNKIAEERVRVAQLREALENIAKYPQHVAEERGVANLRAIARAALKEEDTNG